MPAKASGKRGATVQTGASSSAQTASNPGLSDTVAALASDDPIAYAYSLGDGSADAPADAALASALREYRERQKVVKTLRVPNTVSKEVYTLVLDTIAAWVVKHPTGTEPGDTVWTFVKNRPGAPAAFATLAEAIGQIKKLLTGTTSNTFWNVAVYAVRPAEPVDKSKLRIGRAALLLVACTNPDFHAGPNRTDEIERVIFSQGAQHAVISSVITDVLDRASGIFPEECPAGTVTDRPDFAMEAQLVAQQTMEHNSAAAVAVAAALNSAETSATPGTTEIPGVAVEEVPLMTRLRDITTAYTDEYSTKNLPGTLESAIEALTHTLLHATLVAASHGKTVTLVGVPSSSLSSLAAFFARQSSADLLPRLRRQVRIQPREDQPLFLSTYPADWMRVDESVPNCSSVYVSWLPLSIVQPKIEAWSTSAGIHVEEVYTLEYIGECGDLPLAKPSMHVEVQEAETEDTPPQKVKMLHVVSYTALTTSHHHHPDWRHLFRQSRTSTEILPCPTGHTWQCIPVRSFSYDNRGSLPSSTLLTVCCTFRRPLAMRDGFRGLTTTLMTHPGSLSPADMGVIANLTQQAAQPGVTHQQLMTQAFRRACRALALEGPTTQAAIAAKANILADQGPQAIKTLSDGVAPVVVNVRAANSQGSITEKFVSQVDSGHQTAMMWLSFLLLPVLTNPLLAPFIVMLMTVAQAIYRWKRWILIGLGLMLSWVTFDYLMEPVGLAPPACLYEHSCAVGLPGANIWHAVQAAWVLTAINVKPLSLIALFAGYALAAPAPANVNALNDAGWLSTHLNPATCNAPTASQPTSALPPPPSPNSMPRLPPPIPEQDSELLEATRAQHRTLHARALLCGVSRRQYEAVHRRLAAYSHKRVELAWDPEICSAASCVAAFEMYETVLPDIRWRMCPETRDICGRLRDLAPRLCAFIEKIARHGDAILRQSAEIVRARLPAPPPAPTQTTTEMPHDPARDFERPRSAAERNRPPWEAYVFIWGAMLLAVFVGAATKPAYAQLDDDEAIWYRLRSRNGCFVLRTRKNGRQSTRTVCLGLPADYATSIGVEHSVRIRNYDDECSPRGAQPQLYGIASAACYATRRCVHNCLNAMSRRHLIERDGPTAPATQLPRRHPRNIALQEMSEHGFHVRCWRPSTESDGAYNVNCVAFNAPRDERNALHAYVKNKSCCLKCVSTETVFPVFDANLNAATPTLSREFANNAHNFADAWRARQPPARLRDLEEAGMDWETVVNLVKAFTKTECAHGYPKKARIIQGYRDLSTQVAFAIVTSGIQTVAKHYYRHRDVATNVGVLDAPQNRVTFACGMTPEELERWPTETEEFSFDHDDALPDVRCPFRETCGCTCHDLGYRNGWCDCRNVKAPGMCDRCAEPGRCGLVPADEVERHNCECGQRGTITEIEVDFENYDAHISARHFWAKFDFYNSCLQSCDASLRAAYLWFVVSSFDVRLYFDLDDQSIRARVYGTTKSGHNDTSLGNTVIAIAIDAELGAEFNAMGYDVHAICAGDDKVIRVFGAVPNAAQVAHSVYNRYGMKAKVAVATDIEDVSFLSSVWATDNAGYHRFVWKPGRMLSKMYWSHPAPPEKHAARWRHQVSAATLRTARAIPHLRQWIEGHLDTRMDHAERLYDKWNLMEREQPLKNDSLSQWFYRRYGITSVQGVEFERLCTDLQRYGGCGIVACPLTAAVMARDLQDPCDADDEPDLVELPDDATGYATFACFDNDATRRRIINVGLELAWAERERLRAERRDIGRGERRRYD